MPFASTKMNRVHVVLFNSPQVVCFQNWMILHQFLQRWTKWKGQSLLLFQRRWLNVWRRWDIFCSSSVLLVQLQLSLGSIEQRRRQEWEAVLETRAEDHLIDVLLRGAVFKRDSGGGEGLQVGFDHHSSLQDLAKEVFVNQRFPVEKSDRKHKKIVASFHLKIVL